MDMTGFPDGEPTRVGVAITDYLAGLYAIQGILLALLDRQRSGRGQHVDIALFDAMLSVMRLPLSVLLATGARSDPRRQRSPVDRAVRAAAREGRTDHRRGREPAAVGAVLRRDRAAGSSRRSALQDEHRSRGEPRRAQAASSKRMFQQFTRRGADRAAAGRRTCRAGACARCARRSSIRRCRRAICSSTQHHAAAGPVADARAGREAVAHAGRRAPAAAGARRAHGRSAGGAWRREYDDAHVSIRAC